MTTPLEDCVSHDNTPASIPDTPEEAAVSKEVPATCKPQKNPDVTAAPATEPAAASTSDVEEQPIEQPTETSTTDVKSDENESETSTSDAQATNSNEAHDDVKESETAVPSQTSPSTFKLRADAKVFTPLRADAKEFVPSWLAAAPTSNGYSNGNHSDRNGYAYDHSDSDGYAHSGSNGYHYNSHSSRNGYSYRASSNHAYHLGDTQAVSDHTQEDYDETTDLSSVTMSTRDALSMLSSWFPSYSWSALKAVYEINHSDLNATLQDLCSLQWQEESKPSNHQAANNAIAISLDEETFPALGPAAANGGQATTPCQPMSFAAILKQTPASSKTSAPTSPNPTAPASAKPTSNGAVSEAANGNGNATASAPASKKASSAAAANGNGNSKVSVPWLSTGEAVTAEYSEARETARNLARVRNQYFQQATMAYLAGNKALAKELSEKGRQHNEMMKSAHAAASDQIFATRNSRLKSLQLQDHSGLVDLHGLHVSEAKTVLSGLLNKYSSRNRVLLCVGTGHHTKGSRTPARLPAAVEEYLSSRQLKHRYLQPGLLEVTL